MALEARRVWRRRSIVVATLVLAAAGLLPARGASTVGWDTRPTWGTAAGAKSAGRVLDILEVGPTVYLAGEFTAMVPPRTGPADRVPRRYLAALSAANGELSAWNPAPDGPVGALAVSADQRRLYVGGSFSTVGGRPAWNVAAVDAGTGALDPTFQPPRFDGPVRALLLHGGRLYVGGSFTQARRPDGTTASRSLLAALDAGTGGLLDWAPPASGGGELAAGRAGKKGASGTGSVRDLAMTGDGGMLHVAGTFADLGGRAGLLTLDALSGTPTGWQADAGRPVYGLAVSAADPHRLYAAAGGDGGRLFVFDPGAAAAPAWQVEVDGEALGTVATRSSVYLFGEFDHVVPAASPCVTNCTEGPPRHRMASFVAATGELEGWMPGPDESTVVTTGAVGANRLWVGGDFRQVNGKPQPGIAQFPGTP